MGKIPPKELEKLLGCIRENHKVIVPPRAGYDSGVHLLGDSYVVVSTDPCTGVPIEWFGWLLINYVASDVALFGAKPEFCTINILGPQGTKPEVFQSVMKQACKAANELGIAIVSGHTSTYDSLLQLVGVCTAYGTVKPEKLITPGKARADDCILCTKTIGLETLINFSLANKTLAQHLFGPEQSAKLAAQIKMQSCVKEALKLAEISGVHAMHDATEGGIIAALNEIAEASKLGFIIEAEKLPIRVEMQKIKEHFKLSDEQVLAASSAGTIIVAVDSHVKDEVTEVLQKMGVPTNFVGVFTKNKKRVLTKKLKRKSFPKVVEDPYNRILIGKV